MNRTLLLGLWRLIFPVPRPIWQAEIAQSELKARENGLAFMSADHHRVRDFCVLELPRLARPLSPAWIAERLNLSPERVQTILEELEAHKTFTFRNPQGDVTWAYPVTVDNTPHHITFSSGEQVYAA
jgi:hypothetical protein